MPKEFTNNKKVEVKIQRILSELISLKISDPRLKNIIISEVKLNKDISTAKVYFLVLNNQTKTKQINSILTKATGFFKKEMSSQLGLKKLPNLIFIYDTKEQDALFMKALEDDDSSAQSTIKTKKKALRDAPAAKAISDADTIAKLKAAWDSTNLGTSPYA